MTPIKYTINFLLNTKCVECKDNSFCKLKKYYKLLERPSIKQLDYLTNCLFYEKSNLTKDKLIIKNDKKIS